MKNTTSFRFLLVSRVLLAGLALTGIVAPESYATEFLVNTTQDTKDRTAGDGQCFDGTRRNDGTPNCSLRAAIEESNALNELGADNTIILPPGNYTLSLKGADGKFIPLEITSRKNVYSKLSLQGARSDLTRIIVDHSTFVLESPPQHECRALAIKSPQGPPEPGVYQVVDISGVTITGGKTIEGGSGIRIEEGSSLYLSNSTIINNQGRDNGSGIQNYGFLFIDGCTVSDNGGTFATTGAGGGRTQTGGGISNFGVAEIWHSTISGNKAARGGGIVNEGQLDVNYSTISGNKVFAGGAGIINGLVRSQAQAFFFATTISNNVACLHPLDETPLELNSGGGILNWLGILELNGTILAGNIHCRGPERPGDDPWVCRESRPPCLGGTDPCDPNPKYSPDCFSQQAPSRFALDRGNVIGVLNETNCNFANIDDPFNPDAINQIGAPGLPGLRKDPQLRPLDYYGGRTQTHALPEDSIAIGKGINKCSYPYQTRFGCIDLDQRGALRTPSGDVGAYEHGQPADITQNVQIIPQGFKNDPARKQIRQAVRLQNPSLTDSIAGNIFFVLDQCQFSLLNRDGVSANVGTLSSQYITIPLGYPPGLHGSLEPGEKSEEVVLVFDNPNAANAPPNPYMPRILAGEGTP